MKLGTADLHYTKPYEFPIVRGENVFFLKLLPVPKLKDFEKVMQQPKPPKRTDRKGTYANLKDPVYLERMKEYNETFSNWLILQSLRPTEDLVWEKVNLDDPSTYNLVQEELTEAGLTEAEIVRLVQKITELHGLDEEKIEQAKESFLRARENQLQEPDSRDSEPTGT